MRRKRKRFKIVITLCVVLFALMLQSNYIKSSFLELAQANQIQEEKQENQTKDKSSNATTKNMDETIKASKAWKKETKAMQKKLDAIKGSVGLNWFEGYPVEDTFFLWLYASYGQELFDRLLEAIGQEVVDTSFWVDNTGKSMHVLWLDYCSYLCGDNFKAQNVRWIEGEDGLFTIDIIGDINLADDWYTMGHAAGVDGGISACIDPQIQEELKGADITLLNHEFTLSRNGTALAGKAYTFRGKPENVDYLTDIFGADIVSLANNHVCDYGDEALLDTLACLDAAGIARIGAGKDMNEASEIAYYVCGGKKIAFVTATQIEKTLKYTKEATESNPGVLKALHPEKFIQVISEAEKKSDYVIAYVHWGTEGMLYPDADERQLAEQFVEAGADLIIGNHSHRLQGMQFINEVPVFWSLGNFWFSDGDMYAAIVKLQMDKDGEEMLQVLPCRQTDIETRMLTEQEEVTGFYEYFADLSSGIIMEQDGTIHDNSQGQYSQMDGANIAYESGMEYASHFGGVDLSGEAIDIVGNRK